MLGFYGNMQSIVRINGEALMFRYQLVVVGGRVVGVSVGNQEQLAVGVDGEETQEVLSPAPYKVSDRLGLGLRQGLGPAVDFGAAVRRHPDRCEKAAEGAD